MGINRHNYEEFFLLYIDNELSAADRKAVELFVQENADLEEELNMLQQTVFDADAVVFDNKNSLRKEEITALQEDLLLYIDGELNANSKWHVESLLQTDTAANKELALLQQTKLQPDTAIVFTNKKSLYRKEGGRVIDLPWRRIAAAAILLGFGTWATVSYFKTGKTVGGGGFAIKNQPKTITTPKPIDNTTSTPALQPQQSTAVDINSTTASTDDVIKQAAQKNNVPARNKVQQNMPAPKEDNIIAVKEELKKPNNNLPKPDYNNFNTNNRNETIAENVTVKSTATEKINPGLNKTVDVPNNITNNGEVSGYALNANYTEDNASNNLSPDDTKGKKTKLGGFFRKVKRLVERTTNAKAGDGVKIASFDIAIK